MSLYLDASVIVALFTDDPFTQRADSFLNNNLSILSVSDFAAAEFAAAIARQVRMREMSSRDARTVFSTFDAWSSRATERLNISPADVVSAEAFLRRLDLPLRAPDALHIAIAQRIGAMLVTFDQKMAANAAALGTEAARP